MKPMKWYFVFLSCYLFFSFLFPFTRASFSWTWTESTSLILYLFFFSKAVFLGMLVISERSRFIDKPSWSSFLAQNFVYFGVRGSLCRECCIESHTSNFLWLVIFTSAFNEMILSGEAGLGLIIWRNVSTDLHEKLIEESSIRRVKCPCKDHLAWRYIIEIWLGLRPMRSFASVSIITWAMNSLF